jgi:RNA polymerase sigma-70 factor (ECF subfamily)
MEASRVRKAEIEEQRKLAFAIAYRMTGSVSDAEDIGQEALLRLERARRDGEAVESPRAWLSTVTTRLAIDHMRSARARRESYVGPWLPEPLLTEGGPGPAEHAEVADTASQAFLVLLQTLSPVERAVFLLRDVFGYGYGQISETVGKGEENCRQIARRARKHVEAREARFEADGRHGEELLDRFLEASESGDVEALKEILAADAVVYSDGGGKAAAARRPFAGADRIARFMVKVTRRRLRRGGYRQRRVTINGQPGRLMVAPDGEVTDALTLDVSGGLIQTIRIVRNPDKLRHLRSPSGIPGTRPEAGSRPGAPGPPPSRRSESRPGARTGI